MRKLFLFSFILFLSFSNLAKAEQNLGSRFFSQNINTGTVQVVFTQAANVNGASIRTAALYSTNNAEVALQANYPDGTNRVIFRILAGPGAQNTFGNIPDSIRIPTGVGLSVIANFGGGTVAGAASITYDLFSN